MFNLKYIPKQHFKCGLLFAVLLATCGDVTAQITDETEDIRPPKDMVEIQQPQKTSVGLWMSIGGGVLAIIIAAMLWKRYTGKQKQQSPQEIALASLANLEITCDIMTAETFANRVTQTIRQYIADHFGLAAPRRTTEEFFHDVERSSLIDKKDTLRTFLKSCDLVKFAGANLNESQRSELLETARSFVHTTTKPPVVQP